MTETATPRSVVLVVDDNPLNLELVHEMLSGDYEVLFATSGHEALEVAAACQPDLVLLDVRMPGMDGLEVCRRLKADPATLHIPVIFVTALSDNDNEEAGLKVGAIDYVSKPYSQAILKARIANQLELKRHRDLLARLIRLDPLTGIPNRRHFDEFLEQEYRRALGAGKSLALAMIDVDLMRNYNAANGHQAGDECLKQIAAALQRTQHKGMEQLFRYDSDEFALVLPDLAADSALQLTEALRAAVAALRIPAPGDGPDPLSGAFVTVSAGVAAMIPQAGGLAADLLAAAEYALFRAKAAGRNHCELASGEL